MKAIINLLNISLLVLSLTSSAISKDREENSLVFTVASDPTDGYLRYIRSAKHYGIDVKTLGLGKEWLGGDMSKAGGGYKITLLKEALKQYKGDENRIVLFTDSYDVIFTTSLKEIVKKFKMTGARILFGAEHFCWPDATLADKYPSADGGAKYLNSGLFIGYVSDIYEMLKTPVQNTDDDQLLFTKFYLNEEFRTKHSMKLDWKSEIFQNLNGAGNEVKLDYNPLTSESVISNTLQKTTPNIIHGNGPSKIDLNSFGNYLAGAFSEGKCFVCSENLIELIDGEFPVVTLGVFVEKPMPFFEEFLDRILSIDYPKEKINFFIHSNVKYHEEIVNKFIERFGKEYNSYKSIVYDDSVNEVNARSLAVTQAVSRESDYLFVLDAEAHIDNPSVLRELIKQNKPIIAPMMTRPNEAWSNFWGAIGDSGYYSRSFDYMEIISLEKRGIWNVPFISSSYLIQKSLFEKINYKHDLLDADMAMCFNFREKGVFMNILNLEHYGHLVNDEYFNIKQTRPDFYMLLTNQADWEQRYIHPEYLELLKPNATFKEPCTDVYWFPIATDQFCDDMVAIMEGFGKWSGGTNTDERLTGGYEAVPTRDIHMNQVGLESLWLKFLKLYVRPLQEAVYLGYFHNPPKSLMNFVVRYKPDEQPSLRPHHDSSTYTINIALNTANVDYEGGGCNFIRYNCSVKDTKKGWMLMHPGRLTHYHEGLKTTKGVRYIMISFIDP